MGAETLAPPTSTYSRRNITQTPAKGRQMPKHLFGRGAIEDAREGIRSQENRHESQRDDHNHRQRTQALAQTTSTGTALVERKLLRI